MGESIRAMLANSMMRALALGGIAGAILLSLAFIWLQREQPTVIVSVQHVDDPTIVRVYVGGEVHRPGVVALPRGSRVNDAIEAAGGTTPAGDTSALGLAAVLDDSDQIVVPAHRDVSGVAELRTPTPTAMDTGAVAENAMPDHTLSPQAPAPPAGGSSLVNINSATIEELDSLPGIGPAIAQRIIDYRTSEGPFQTIDELERIRGISARMVGELTPFVTVGS
jgi:competence protein ComEA